MHDIIAPLPQSKPRTHDVAWYVKDARGEITVVDDRNGFVAGPFLTHDLAWKWIARNTGREWHEL